MFPQYRQKTHGHIEVEVFSLWMTGTQTIPPIISANKASLVAYKELSNNVLYYRQIIFLILTTLYPGLSKKTAKLWWLSKVAHKTPVDWKLYTTLNCLFTVFAYILLTYYNKAIKLKAKERYTHLNAEFQRIVGRDKNAFLSDHCKEIKENNRIGKTKGSLQENERYQGNISCKDGHNKG